MAFERWEGQCSLRLWSQKRPPGNAGSCTAPPTRAANTYHAAQRLTPGESIRYKVAWLASYILYDRSKLLRVGGFGFWSRLPRYHSGEEVLVQNLLMRRWGGCGILPSGTYYAQVPTTMLNARGTVDGHALDLLPEMVARYAAPFSDDQAQADGIGREQLQPSVPVA